jgi:hypothetical protein
MMVFVCTLKIEIEGCGFLLGVIGRHAVGGGCWARP